MSIPKSMQPKYDEIAAVIEPYCDQYLNGEYKQLCLAALEKLCRKRPSPLLKGRARTWAAGIVYAIGQNNWIFDKTRAIHMTSAQLVEPFGVSASTASSKAAEIRKMLEIDYFNWEWVLPSELEDNQMIWYVEMNGMIMDARMLPADVQQVLAERGIIPYAPALQEE